MRFRPAALKEIGEPERLDEPPKLAGWKAWAVAGSLVVALTATLMWGLLGTVTRSVAAPGILSYADGVTDMQATGEGRVEKVWVRAAERVEKGQHLYTYRTFDGTVVNEVAPWDAYVINLLASEGQVISHGQPVASLERLGAGRDRLRAMVFLSAAQAPAVRVGSSVELEVSSVAPAAFGTLTGEVTSVGRFPETASSLKVRLGSQSDVGRYLQDDQPIVVMIELSQDSDGHLTWSKSGPPFVVTSQSQVTASFLVSEQRPIDWVIRRW